MRLFDDAIPACDDPLFSRALRLAARASGRTSPNPLVGCLIVRDGEIVGEGYHQRAGGPHAEVVALSDAGDAALGANAYVTLEPCAHFGKTPPCADALIAAGVRRVFIGMADPTPVAGGGAQRLRDAGVDVAFAEDPSPFAELNEEWLKRLATGLPFVTVKLGMSLDAHLSLAEQTPAAMTGPSGARVTRQLRATHAAVAVSAATIASDDPALTLRDSGGELDAWQPTRIVLVRESLPPVSARVLNDGLAETVVVAPKGLEVGDLETRASAVLRYASDGGMEAMLRAVADAGFDSVLVEAGPRLLSALWSSGVVDRLVTVTAGGMAGCDAPCLFAGTPDTDGSAIKPRMTPTETAIVGDVSVTVWRPRDADSDS